MNLAALLAGARPREGGFALTVPESWHQGRTAYGGLSSALCLAAAMQAGGQAGGEGAIEDLPPLRSAQLAMIAPVAGEIAVSARVQRRGRNATWVAAEIVGAGGPAFAASLVFMGPAASSLHLDERALPGTLVPLDDATPVPDGRGVSFLKNYFDIRFALPPEPAPRAERCWWVRARDRDGLDPMTGLLLCADALPPGVMSLLDRGTPVSTMHWQVNLLTAAPATRDGWWLLHAASDYAQDGCSSQRMAKWNTDGEPMMAGMQSVALFG